MDIEIKSVENMINEVKKLNKGFGKLWYRGHSDKSWELIPSVQRGSYKKDGVEQDLLNEFLISVCASMNNRPNGDEEYVPGWMTLMQHYGLPTRLLDWSASPLIALFFATNNYDKYENIDGCIWVLRPETLNKIEGFGSKIYPMDKMCVQNMLRPAFHGHEVDDSVKDKIIACRPVEYDMRVYTQQSAFTVHNTDRKLEKIARDDLLYKFIIPSKCKKNILEELRILGITLSNIFPDAEHIAQELRKNHEK